MKKPVLLHLILILASVHLAAADNRPVALSLMTGMEEPISEIIPLICDIDTAASSTTVAYHIENMVLYPDTLYVGASKCTADGFGTASGAGVPGLPVRYECIPLPYGCEEVKVTVTKAEFIDIPCEVAPAYPDYLGNIIPHFTKENVPAVEKCSFGTMSDIATANELINLYGTPYVEVVVQPCQYDSDVKMLRVYHDIEYRVDYIRINQQAVLKRNVMRNMQRERFKANMAKISIGDIDTSKTSIKNPFDTTFIKPSDPDTIYHFDYNPNNNKECDDYIDVYLSYLIITCDKYLEAAEDFAAFKRKMGFITHILSRRTWTPQQVRDSIKAYHHSQTELGMYFHVRYGLIIGGENDIPAVEDVLKRKTIDGLGEKGYAVKTDYYYAAYENDSYISMHLGRFPVNTPEEAMAAVEKTKNYILSPTTEDRFYKTGAHIAQFDGATKETHPHIYNSEECRNILLGNWSEKDVTRLYWAGWNAKPQKYGPKGEDLPIELQKPNYLWNTSKYTIAEELGKGDLYVLYRGHGSGTGYEDIFLEVEDIDRGLLTNGNLQPVFFNFTCNTGLSMAGSLLKCATGGGVGVIAAKTETRCENNNAISRNLFNNIWGTVIKDEYKYSAVVAKSPCFWQSELATMFNTAIALNPEMNNDDKRFNRKSYHIFGDPSLRMWLQKPREFRDDEVWCCVHFTSQMLAYAEVYLDFHDEGAYVAIEDKETHETQLCYGNRITFPRFDPNKYSMMIYGHDRIPKEVKINDYPLVADTTLPKLSLSLNRENTVLTISYHISGRNTNTPVSAGITVYESNLYTSNRLMDEFTVKGHVGRVELDVSKYSPGYHIVTLTERTVSGGEPKSVSKKIYIWR